MATLYEIDEEILNCVDQETGEIIDPKTFGAVADGFWQKGRGNCSLDQKPLI